MIGTDPHTIEVVADALAKAQLVVVATGAGMSRESGIPTFRDALTGLWARFDPEELATEQAFRRAPARVFGWYAWRRKIVRAAVPHPGYDAVVALERLVPELVVITQNVDGLHRRAGSGRVLELHGSLDRFHCLDQRHPYPGDAVVVPEEDGELDPPFCPRCGSPIRPGVVWFGEMLPEPEVAEAWELAARCDVMLVVGTSGMVQPAAALPGLARKAGAMVVEVNPEPSEISSLATATCRGPAGTVLPALVARLRGDA